MRFTLGKRRTGDNGWGVLWLVLNGVTGCVLDVIYNVIERHIGAGLGRDRDNNDGNMTKGGSDEGNNGDDGRGQGWL